MLINESAILLNLLSIALMGLLTAIALLVLVWPFTARYITQLSACTQQKVLWLFVATPWAASIICVFIFFFLPYFNRTAPFGWADLPTGTIRMCFIWIAGTVRHCLYLFWAPLMCWPARG